MLIKKHTIGFLSPGKKRKLKSEFVFILKPIATK